MASQVLRVGELRPNQLLHTYGVGAVADLPNLSVVVAGLDDWELANSLIVTEGRLLAAVQAQLGPQVETLRTPPYKPESADPFGDWARIGVPVRLFPRWLRCSDTRCNRLAPVESRLFDLLTDPWRPERIRYVHGCRGHGYNRPTAVPARFVLACERGHLDDFPWLYYVHGGTEPTGGEHTLRLSERGTTGEAANLFVECSCDKSRPMAQALGREAFKALPGCRGRHPHLGTFEECGVETRTLGLGATNGWFAMQIRAFSLPLADTEVDQRVAENWPQLNLLVSLPQAPAKALLPSLACWPDVEPYGADAVWEAILRRAEQEDKADDGPADIDLKGPEWQAFTRPGPIDLPDFTAGKNRHRLRSAPGCRMWSWFRACARCPRSMASPGSTRRSGKSCPPTVTTSARSRARRRPGFRARRPAVRESSCGSARTGSPPGKARPRSWRAAGSWPPVTTSGARTGGWCPANGPACGTSCCTPSRTR